MFNSLHLINCIHKNDNSIFMPFNKLIPFIFPQDSHPAKQSHNYNKDFARVILVSPGHRVNSPTAFTL